MEIHTRKIYYVKIENYTLRCVVASFGFSILSILKTRACRKPLLLRCFDSRFFDQLITTYNCGEPVTIEVRNVDGFEQAGHSRIERMVRDQHNLYIEKYSLPKIKITTHNAFIGNGMEFTTGIISED